MLLLNISLVFLTALAASSIAAGVLFKQHRQDEDRAATQGVAPVALDRNSFDDGVPDCWKEYCVLVHMLVGSGADREPLLRHVAAVIQASGGSVGDWSRKSMSASVPSSLAAVILSYSRPSVDNGYREALTPL